MTIEPSFSSKLDFFKKLQGPTTPPSKISHRSVTNAPVIKALNQFFGSTHNTCPTNFLSSDTLNKIFANETDLSSLIQTILSQRAETSEQKVRQYRDLSLCLNLLDRKIASVTSVKNETKDQMHRWAKSVDEASQRLIEEITPEWVTPFEELEFEALLKVVYAQSSSLDSPTESRLKQQGKSPITDSVAAHIHAESYLKGTRFEGEQAIHMLKYVHDYHLKHPSEGKEEEPFRQLIADSISFNQNLDAFLKLQQRDEAAHYVHTSLTDLIPGASLLLQFGWIGSPGHAMYLKITKDLEGKYHAHLYDLSQAPDKRAIIIDRGVCSSIPYFEMQSISPDSLLHEDTLKAYVELLSFPLASDGEPTNYDINDVMSAFWEHLNGVRTSPIDQGKNRSDFMDFQKIGNCSWRSLVAVMHHHMPQKTLHRHLFKIREDSLCSLYQTSAKDLGLPHLEEARILLKNSAEAHIRLSLEDYARGFVTLRELDATRATLVELFKELKIAESKSNYINETHRNFSKIELEWETLSTSFASLQPVLTSLKDLRVSQPETRIFAPDVVSPFELDLTKPLHLELQKIVGTVTFTLRSDSVPKETGISLAVALHQLFCDLPGPDDPYWNSGVHDYEQIMVCLADLSEAQAYLQNYFPDKIAQEKTDLYNLKLLALHYQLAIKLGHPYTAVLPESKVFIPELVKILEEHPKNSLSDAADRRVLEEVRSFIFRVDPPLKMAQNLFNMTTEDPTKANGDKDLLGKYKDCNFNEFPVQSNELRGSNVPEHRLILAAIQKRRQNINPETIAKFASDTGGKYLSDSLAALRKLYYTILIPKEGVKLDELKWLKVSSMIQKDHWGSPQKIFVWRRYLTDTREKVPAPLMAHQNLVEVAHPKNNLQFFGQGVREKQWEQLRDLSPRQKEILLLMSSEGPDFEQTKVLQGIRLLSFYTQHAISLAEPQEQVFFKGLLLEGNLLEDWMRTNSESAPLLANFFNNQIHRFRNLGDLGTVAFLLETCRHVEEIVKTNCQIPPEGFPNYREVIKDILAKNHPTETERVQLYAQVAASYTTHPPATFSTDEAIAYLTAEFYVQTKWQEEIPIAKTTFYATDVAHSRLFKPLEELLGNYALNHAILNKTLENLLEDSTKNNLQVSWSGEGYTLGDHTFDLNKRSFSIKGLSKYIRADTIFQGKSRDHLGTLFNQKTYIAHQMHDASFQFEDERGLMTRIQHLQDGSMIAQKLEGDRWYQLLTDQQQNDLVTDFKAKVIFENHTPWVDTETKTILFLDDQHQARYVATYNDDFKIIKISPKESPNLQLLDLTSSPTLFSRFNNVSSDSMTLLWGDKNNVPKLLEFPQHRLKFTIKPQQNESRGRAGWIAESEQFSGYRIASNQRVKGWGNLSSLLVLENDKGQRKVIVPKGKIISKSGALSKSFTLSIQQLPAKERSVYAFDLKGPLSLHPMQREDSIFTAYLLLGSKRYSEALQLIKKSDSPTFPLNAKEKELLEWIAALPASEKDNEPHAAAVALAAAARLLQADGKLDKVLLEPLTAYFESYQLVKNEMPGYVLPKELDDRLFSYLKGEGCFRDKLWGQFYDKEIPYYSYNYLKTAQEVPSSLHLEELIKETSNAYKHLFDVDGDRSFSKSIEIRPDAVSESDEASKFETLPIDLVTRPGNLVKSFESIYQACLRQDSSILMKLEFAKNDSQNSKAVVQFFKTVYKNPSQFPQFLKFKPLDLLSSNKTIEKEAKKAYLQLLTISLALKEEQEQPAVVLKALPEAVIEPTDLTKEIQNQLKVFAPAAKEASHRILTPQQLQNNFQPTPNKAISLTPEQVEDLVIAISGEEGVKSLSGESLEEDVKTYWLSPDRKKEWNVVPGERLENLHVLLNVQRTEERKQLHVEQLKLLDFANQLPGDLKSQILVSSLQQGDLKLSVTLPDILRFALKRPQGATAPSAANPVLAEQEAHLLERLRVYLVRESRTQQIERALDHLEKAEKRKVELPANYILEKDIRYALYCQQAFQELNDKPNYDTHANLSYLVFETLTKMRLFPWQVSDLDALFNASDSTEKGLILQKIMGSGKSKVYLPLLALMLADGEFLPILVVPQSQYESGLKDLDKLSSEVLGQPTRKLEMTRDSDVSLSKLNKIHAFLEEVIANKEYIVMTDKSIQSLGLTFYDLWMEYLTSADSQPVLEQKIEKMCTIISLLREKGKMILDEADLLLNCRFELNYTLGKERVVNQKHCQMVAEIYEMLATTELKPYLNGADEKQELPPLVQEDYEANILPKLIEKVFLEQLDDKHLLGQELAKLPECNLDLVKAYVRKEQAGKDYVNALPQELQSLLAIVREQLNVLIPHTLNKICGVNYGYGLDPSEPTAVPFLASNTPSLRSKFGFLYTLLNYTTQTLLQKGVKESVLSDYLDNLKHQAESELEGDPSKELEETAGYEAFMLLCGDLHKELPFLRLQQDDIQKIANFLDASPERLLRFAKEHIFPIIKRSPLKISSNPLDLVSLVYQVIGFTGTPWNRATFPTKLRTKIEQGTDGKTVGILWANSQGEAVTLKPRLIPEPISVIEQKKKPSHALLVQQIVAEQKEKKEPFHAFIDAGAVFKNASNQEVANAFLSSLPSTIQGVVFYNSEGRIMVLERNNSNPVPLENSSIPLSHLYTYYDQWHTTGSDIKQDPNACAWVSIGKSLSLRDLLQAVWRLRELDRSQKVRFIVDEDARKHILKELGLTEGSLIGLKEILKYVKRNESKDLVGHLLTAATQRLRHVAKEAVNTALINPKGKFATIRSSSKEITPLISEALADVPFDLFGKGEKEIPKKIYFQRAVDQTLTRLKPLLQNEIFQGLDLKALEEQLWKEIPLELFPDMVKSADTSPTDQQMESEQLQEKEDEQQREKESHQEREESSVGASQQMRRILEQKWLLSQESLVKRESYRENDLSKLVQLDSYQFMESFPSETFVLNHLESSNINLLDSRDSASQGKGSFNKSPFSTSGPSSRRGSITFDSSAPSSRRGSISELPVFGTSGPSSRRGSITEMPDFGFDVTESHEQPTQEQSIQTLLQPPEKFQRPPFFSLQALFERSEGLKKFNDVFSLETTHNFLPIRFRYNPLFETTVRAETFDEEQLRVRGVLMLKDGKSETSRAILVDQEEFLELLKSIPDAKSHSEKSREVELFLYELHLGQITTTSPKKGATPDPVFVARTLVEAKFFNGEMIYSKKEEPVLKAWLMEKGLKRMEELFKDYILRGRPDELVLYPQSKLAKLFAEWRG